MTMQRTLSIIKPDAVKSNSSGDIISFLEKKGLKVVAQKKILLTKKQADDFYKVHRDKPFYNDLVEFMISGPVVVQVLEHENAILFYREIMGNTDPEKAEENTIRKKYGSNIQCNAVHGSDSIENSEIEISFFFSGLELIK